MATRINWMPQLYNEDTVQEVMKLRALMGLSPIRPGIRKCYRCGEKFHTPDVCRIRCCPSCKTYLQDNGISDNTLQGGTV